VSSICSIIIREMLPRVRACLVVHREGGRGGGRERERERKNAGSSRPVLKTLHARNSSKEPLRAFLFFFIITRELKIETGLARDPEIDRGHHSYKRHTIQEYSVCTVGRTEKTRRVLLWTENVIFLLVLLFVFSSSRSLRRFTGEFSLHLFPFLAHFLP